MKSSDIMIRSVVRFLRCRKGVGTLEFAIIAPTFMLILFGIVEFSMAMVASAVLENAVNDASRFGITGYTNPGETREESIRNLIVEKTGSLLDPNQLEITTLIYQNFDQIAQPEPYLDANANGQHDEGETYTDINGNSQWDDDMGAAGLGGAGDIVVYQIEYDWPLRTPLVSHLAGENGTIHFTSNIVVRNEPYDYAPIGG